MIIKTIKIKHIKTKYNSLLRVVFQSNMYKDISFYTKNIKRLCSLL